MSVLKKLGAVTLGMGMVVGGVVANLLKAGFEAAANKVGNGSSHSGYTKDDFNNAAANCNDGIFRKGFETAKNLWKDE